MSDRKAAIRLGTEGKAQVIRDLADIADAGEAGQRRLVRANQRATEEVEAALQRQAATAAKLSAAYGGPTPVQQRIDAVAGPAAGNSGKSARESALAFREAIDAQERLEARTRSFLAALNPTYAAQERFNTQMAEAKGLVSAGAITLDQYCEKLRQEKSALDSVAGAKVRDVQMSGQQRAGYQQLGFQINDIAASYASGGSLMTIFAQQSGQLFQALGLITAGGAGAAAAIEQAGGASDDASVDVGGLGDAVVGVSEKVENGSGRLGAFAAFMSGPWGAAVVAAVSILTPYVAKLFESEEALDDVVEKLKEDAAASQRAAQAKALFGQSLEGVEQALRAEEDALKSVAAGEDSAAVRAANETRAQRDLALSIRQKTQARLADLVATSEAIKNSPFTSAYMNQQGMTDQGASAIDALREQLAAAERATAAAERLLNIRMVDVVNENADVLSDPIKRITRQYDDMAKAARNRARAAADGSAAARAALQGELLSIARNKEAAIEAEQAKQRALSRTATVRRDGDAATAASVAKMLRAEVPGVHVTSTTGGKHVKNSYHYRNQAIDFVPPGGMGSMTKDDVRRIFSSRGIDIIELLGPGDKGHSDHFHVAWAKGKASLDEFADAAKRAEERADALAGLTRQYAPLTAAADAYRQTLAQIDRLKPANADEQRAGARAEYLQARSGLLGSRIGLSGLEAGGRDEQAAIDRQKQEDDRRIEFVRGMMMEQGEALELARAELLVVGANDNYRDRALAKAKLIADLKRAGVATDSAEGVQILANADAYEAVLRQLREQRAVWEEIRGFGGDLVNTVLSPDTWSDWGEGGKRVLDMLKQEFIKLALLNPIRNLLFGEQNASLSSVFGALGKVFGATNAIPGGSQGFVGPPGAASGTPYTSGGDMLVGEFGREIVRMPTGASVVPAGETRRILADNDRGSAGGTVINVYADRAVLADEVRGWIAGGMAQAATQGAAGGEILAEVGAVRREHRSLGRRWR